MRGADAYAKHYKRVTFSPSHWQTTRCLFLTMYSGITEKYNYINFEVAQIA